MQSSCWSVAGPKKAEMHRTASAASDFGRQLMRLVNSHEIQTSDTDHGQQSYVRGLYGGYIRDPHYRATGLYVKSSGHVSNGPLSSFL